MKPSARRGQRKTRRRVMNEIVSQIPPRFWEDEEWAYEHYAELLNLYPNKWVAIVGKKVVAVSDGSGKILEEARTKTAQAHIAMVFIEDGSHVY
jgi:hypothetical protein